MYQDIKYDFSSELVGTGYRSEFDIEGYYYCYVVFSRKNRT